MTSAMYAGSFDPVTNGHAWMIAKGASLFDTLHVVISVNPTKTPLFGVQQRLKLLVAVCGRPENIIFSSVEGQFLVKHAKNAGVTHLLRGIRPGVDFDYEHRMRQINSDIEPTIETVFLMPPRELAEISSSIVKSFMGLDGWLGVAGKYVAEPVLEALGEAK